MVQRLNFFIAFLCPVLLTLLMKACSWYHHAVIIIIMMLGMIVFFLFLFFFYIFYVFLVWLSVKLRLLMCFLNIQSLRITFCIFLVFSASPSILENINLRGCAWWRSESLNLAVRRHQLLVPCIVHMWLSLSWEWDQGRQRDTNHSAEVDLHVGFYNLCIRSFFGTVTGEGTCSQRGVFHRSSCSPRGDCLRLLAQLSWISPIAAKILWPPSCGKKFYRCAQRLVHVVALREWRNWPLLGRFRLPLFWREFFPPFGFKCCKNGCTDRKRSRENPVLFQKAPTVVEKAFPL